MDIRNKNFKRLNEVVCEYEGFVHITNPYLEQVTNIYLNTMTKAVEASLLIATHLLEENKTLKQVTLIDQGEITITLAGSKERIQPVILSKRLQFFEKLLPILETAQCNMFLTKEALEALEDKENYEYRYIGYILNEAQEKIELYDFYQSEDKEHIKIKRGTQKLFNKALNLFYERRFYEAMNLFLNVIEENREDEIARWYAFRCDKLYRNWDEYDTLELMKCTNEIGG